MQLQHALRLKLRESKARFCVLWASLSLMIFGPQPREPKCPTYLPAPTQFYFDATIARKGDSSIQTGSAWDGRAVTVATAPTVLNIGLGWAKLASVQRLIPEPQVLPGVILNGVERFSLY